MANVEINDLTVKTTPVGTDEIEIQETSGGTSKKATLVNLASNYLATLYTGLISGLAAKTTPASTDELVIQETAAGTQKKITMLDFTTNWLYPLLLKRTRTNIASPTDAYVVAMLPSAGSTTDTETSLTNLRANYFDDHYFRAWAHIGFGVGSSPSIDDSQGVASVGDGGTGITNVVLSDAMANKTFSGVATVDVADGDGSDQFVVVGTLRPFVNYVSVYTSQGDISAGTVALTDLDFSVVAMGDLA